MVTICDVLRKTLSNLEYIISISALLVSAIAAIIAVLTLREMKKQYFYVQIQELQILKYYSDIKTTLSNGRFEQRSDIQSIDKELVEKCDHLYYIAAVNKKTMMKDFFDLNNKDIKKYNFAYNFFQFEDTYKKYREGKKAKLISEEEKEELRLFQIVYELYNEVLFRSIKVMLYIIPKIHRIKLKKIKKNLEEAINESKCLLCKYEKKEG